VSLESSPVPPPGPDDRVRGERGPVVIEYGDYECPFCAKADLLLRDLPIRRVWRHFPVSSKHPRAPALARAAEAAAMQDRFWEMHDSLFDDHARLDDPHLWERCRRLGIDLERFESDRRSDAVEERVQRDFRSGIRAGVANTPTLFVEGKAHAGVPDEELTRRLQGDGR
jgi:protein-disulfide isomerase